MQVLVRTYQRSTVIGLAMAGFFIAFHVLTLCIALARPRLVETTLPWLSDPFWLAVSSALSASAAIFLLAGLVAIHLRREGAEWSALFSRNTDLEEKVVERTDELASMNGALAKSLEEKEFLFREIHHRIKNNLQIVASMVRLSGKGNTDKVAQAVLDDIARRIRAMGLFHQTLYEQTEGSQVDLAVYLSTMLDAEAQIFGAIERGIAIEIEARGMLDLDMAVSVGMVISEAFSNCIKYAFIDRPKGRICVKAEARDGTCRIEIIDDGIGIPEQVTDGTGMTIMRTIARARNADLSISSDHGTRVRLEFTY